MEPYRIAEELMVGVIGGVLSGFLVFVLLARLKPRIEISEKIEHPVDSRYVIEIINRTKAPVVDLKAELQLVRSGSERQVAIERTQSIALLKHEIFELAKFDANDPRVDYAYRFVTNEDLGQRWHEGHILRFRVHAIHSWSNFGKTFTRDYHHKNSDIIAADVSVR